MVRVEGLDDLARDAMRRYRLPGLSMGVSQAGQELFADGFGYADVEKTRSVTPDTLFGVASVTKLATALLTMRLQQRERLSVYDPVTRFFPAFGFAGARKLRLHHLLTHSAGVPGLPSRFHATDLADPDNRSGGVEGLELDAGTGAGTAGAGILTSDDLVALLNRLDFHPLGPPGTLLSYCNEGYCLLGGVAEAILGLSYREAVEQEVFLPLEMTRSVVGATGLHRFDDVATPLRRSNDGFVPVNLWDAPLFYAAGGLVSAARDLIRLVAALDEDSDFLTPEHVELMTSAQMPVASRPSSGIGYGYGLEYERLDPDNTLVWHSGQRAGVSSFVARLLEQRLSVALISNVDGAPLASLGHDVIAHLLGRGDIVWPPVGEDLTCGQQATRFTGRYGSSEGFEFCVGSEDGDLFLQGRTGRQPLCFADPSSGTVAGQTFRFLADDQDAVWAFALDLRVFRRLDAAETRST